MDLYCHGSVKNQAKTTVVIDGQDTKLARLSLVCNNTHFVDTGTQVVI